MALPGTLSQQALAVVVEPLAAGRRVAVFGDASAGLDAILVDQGARAVTLLDPDPERASEAAEVAPEGVAVLPYGEIDDLGSTDVAIVADLGLFDDPAELLARVRRMVGDDGVAVIAAANADARDDSAASDDPRTPRAFDYYDLFDRVATEFHTVRMVAQLPFFGIALMELGAEEDDPGAVGVNVDTRLADQGRTPEGFVVVASQYGGQDERPLHPYSIVELPFEEPELLDAEPLAAEPLEAAPVEPAAPAVDEAVIAALAEAQARADRLSREVAQLSEAHGRADLLARELGDARLRSGAIEHEYAQAVEAQAVELARIEEVLRERAQAIRLLEGEVARRDRMVYDLLGALEESRVEAPAASPGGPAMPPMAEERREPAASREAEAETEAAAAAVVALRARLDTLALDLARREGEAHASAWEIEELERKLIEATALKAAHPPRDALHEEIDALRQALVQEHAARVRAESGDEVTQLRAEVARQAALLDRFAHGGQAPGVLSAEEASAEATEREVSR
jgi:hypothetical protein